jgi:microbial collagenase
MLKHMIQVIGVIMLMILVVFYSGCITESDEDKEDEDNIQPTADAGGDMFVNVGEYFPFNGSGSDVDGEIVLYEWDVDGDGEYDMSCHMCGTDGHIYEEAGMYHAKLRVTDDKGATDTDICKITVS